MGRNWEKLFKTAKKIDSVQIEVDELISKTTGLEGEVRASPTLVNFDIAIITATAEEFRAVENIVNDVDEVNLNHDDTVIYFAGTLKGKGKTYNVLIPYPQSMGSTAAANITTKVLAYFPTYVFMVGIAAGNKNLSKIGDVLIAEKAINYNEVVEIENKSDEKIKKKFRQNANSIDANLKSKLSLMTKKTDFEQIKEAYQNSSKLSVVPKCIIGTLITGSSMIRSQEKVKDLNASYHGVIGLDMETHGVYYACSNSLKKNAPKFVSIKSVSDFGDNSKHTLKSSERKDYALYTSSTVFKLFVENYL